MHNTRNQIDSMNSSFLSEFILVYQRIAFIVLHKFALIPYSVCYFLSLFHSKVEFYSFSRRIHVFWQLNSMPRQQY